MGRRNNFCTDEETTRRAVDWLRNGAKSRGLELEYMIGRTLSGTVITGEIPAERLAVITGAILGELARSWQKRVFDGELSDDELDIAAVVSAACASLVEIVNGNLDLDPKDDYDAQFMKACLKMMEEGEK